jgi:hypothetical protein
MAVQRLSVAKLMNGGQSVPMLHGAEEASSTFSKGDPLIVASTAGQVEEAATEPVDNIYGIANEDASGTTAADVAFVPALPGIIFEGNIGTSTSAGAIAASDLNALYPLQLSSGDWFVDKTDNTNPCVRVVGFRDKVGTVNGRVYFVFIQDATAFAN